MKNYNNIKKLKSNRVYSLNEIMEICNVEVMPNYYKKISNWNSEKTAIGKRLLEDNRKAVKFEEDMKIMFVEL